MYRFQTVHRRRSTTVVLGGRETGRNTRIRLTYHNIVLMKLIEPTRPRQSCGHDHPKEGLSPAFLTDSMFQREIHNSSTVCRNCFRRRRRELPAWELDERDPDRTAVSYAPTPRMSDSRFVHCECGATSPFVRIWDVDDIHRERMRELIRATIRTFEAKGFVVDRHRFAAIALAGWKRIPREGVHGPRRQTPIDDALEEATDAAVREPPTDQQVVTV